MAFDVATKIVEVAQQMQNLEIAQNEERKLKERKDILMKNFICININYVSEYENDEDQTCENFNDYNLLRFTKYDGDIYWVISHNQDNDDMKVINLTKNPKMIKKISKDICMIGDEEQFEYNNRKKMAMFICFPKKIKCVHDDKEFWNYTCNMTFGQYYKKNVDMSVIINDALELINEIDVL